MALIEWKEKIFQRYLIWQCRPARLHKHLKEKLPGSVQPGPVDRKKIRVAAVQMELKLFKSPLGYSDEIHRRVIEAKNAGARLVIFPEYNSLQLLGMLPGIEQIEESYGGKVGDQGENKEEDQPGLADIFKFISPAVLPLVHTVYSKLASAYGLYIMAGSYPLVDKGSLVNRAFLYGPGGALVGSQDKVHLLPMEEKWPINRGSSFSFFDTELGRLAMPVCMDATYYETFRLLEMAGVETVLLPIADQQEYNFWLALRGIWPRVQESPLYGVKSAMVGTLAGYTFTGRAGIFAPLELTAKRDGVLAEVEPFDREAIAVADLDLEALKQLRCSHPWRDSNPELYRRYFPEIYREN